MISIWPSSNWMFVCRTVAWEEFDCMTSLKGSVFESVIHTTTTMANNILSLLSYFITFFFLLGLFVGLDFMYSESIAGSPGQWLVWLVLLFCVSPILGCLAISYDPMEILTIMSTFITWNYIWCQMACLLCWFVPYSRTIYSDAAFLDLFMSFTFPIDQLPLLVTISLSVFMTILVFLFTEYTFYKLLRFSEGKAGVLWKFSNTPASPSEKWSNL